MDDLSAAGAETAVRFVQVDEIVAADQVQFGRLASQSGISGRRELADLAESLPEYRLDADPLATFELVHQDQRLGVPHLAAL